jgi:hypothetical protein
MKTAATSGIPRFPGACARGWGVGDAFRAPAAFLPDEDALLTLDNFAAFAEDRFEVPFATEAVGAVPSLTRLFRFSGRMFAPLTDIVPALAT